MLQDDLDLLLDSPSSLTITVSFPPSSDTRRSTDNLTIPPPVRGDLLMFRWLIYCRPTVQYERNSEGQAKL